MSEPTIRDYVQHKWPCALLGDGASWAVVPKDSVCTCGLDRLLAALAAPPARSESAQRYTGALIEAGSYEGITVRPSEVSEWTRASDFDMLALNHQSQMQYCLNHHAPKPDTNSVLLSVPRDEVEAVTAFLTQRAAGGAEGQKEPATYQSRVRAWVLACFGETIANDMTERAFRFLEEALELVQAVGCTEAQAARLVGYVFGRPVGQLEQEVGGVMVTLAALTNAAGIELEVEAERELSRVCSPDVTAKIRRKQAAKRGVVSHAAEAALPGWWSESHEAAPIPQGERAPEKE